MPERTPHRPERGFPGRARAHEGRTSGVVSILARLVVVAMCAPS
ncbi:Hypothetical protein A7982_07087 [Minicystis rosea]|nr:Hypothetical protein A7982_07087 [Minicystis rosea]